MTYSICEIQLYEQKREDWERSEGSGESDVCVHMGNEKRMHHVRFVTLNVLLKGQFVN